MYACIITSSIAMIPSVILVIIIIISSSSSSSIYAEYYNELYCHYYN